MDWTSAIEDLICAIMLLKKNPKTPPKKRDSGGTSHVT